jgi:NifU-like protein involved in Fe-S cluster formation
MCGYVVVEHTHTTNKHTISQTDTHTITITDRRSHSCGDAVDCQHDVL